MKFLQILIVFFFLKIITAFGIPTNTDSIVAIVNNNIILNSDIKKKIKIMKYNACDNPLLNITQEKNTYNTVLNNLIIDNLIFQIAEQNNIKINQDQIDQLISSIAYFRDITLNQFYLYLNHIGLNYTTFSLEISHSILKKLICNYLLHHQYNSCILPMDIENAAQKLNFINFNKIFKLIHIIIDLPIPASSLQINASENLAKLIIKKRLLNQNINTIIKTYYKNNILPNITVKHTEWIKWKNIPVIFDQYLETAKKGDIIGPIQSYDGIHILEIQDICTKQCDFPVIKVKINEIISKNISKDIYIKQKLSKIKKNIENSDTTFSIIIQENNKDFYSNNYGNSVQWVDLDNFEPSIQKLLLSLKKDQIGMPVYTDKGWYLIKLMDIDKLSYSTIIYERSYSYLLHQKFNEIFNNWIKELKTTSYITVIN